MPKAIGYFREEHLGQDGQPSLTEQSRAFLEFCRREGFEIGATFLDSDSSDESGFRQIIAYLKRNGAGVTVVVGSLSQLGRDMRRAVRAYFQLEGLEVPLRTLDGIEPTTELVLASWSARDASERVGERVREAMRRKAIKGEVLGRPPYGYGVGPRRRLQPIAHEAAIVRHIFHLYNEDGLGIRLIARRLNEEGYQTKRGGNWSMVTIRDILRNRTYLGTYSRFGVRVPGSHPPIISTEAYRRAQERMSRRRTATGQHSVGQFLLSGLAQCGYCGNRMIGVSRRQSWQRRADGTSVEAEYRYYQCESRTNQSICDYHTRRAAALEEEVRAALEADLQQEIEAAQDSPATDIADDLKAMQVRLRLLDRRLEQLLDAGSAGRLRVPEVHDLSVAVAQQQVSLEEAIEGLEARASLNVGREQRNVERDQCLADLEAARWQASDFEHRRQRLHDLVRCIVVHDNSVELVRRPA